MAGSYNKVILMGNLTRDPELKHLTNTAVCNIGIAVNRKFKKADGEKVEETTFVDCKAWGKTGEIIAQYFGKGQAILVEGRLNLEQWQDKDGGNRSKLVVIVESFEFCGGKGEGGDSGNSTRDALQTKPRRQPAGPTNTKSYEPIDDSQIPFS